MPVFADLRAQGLIKFNLPNNEIIDSLLHKIIDIYDDLRDWTSTGSETM